MKFSKRYNRTAKHCRRFWIRSGVSAIVLCFGLVFGLASVGRASTNDLTKAQLVDAIVEALSRFGENDAFYTYPFGYESDEALDALIKEYFTYSVDPGVYYKIPALQYGSYITQLSVNSNLNNIVSILHPARKPTIYEMIANGFATGDTNLVRFLEPILAPEGEQPFYSMIHSSFDDLYHTLSSIDELLDGHLGMFPERQWFDDLDTSVDEINTVLSSLSDTFTTSGFDNQGFPAIEVNDSLAHSLLSALREELGDGFHELLDSIESSGGGSEAYYLEEIMNFVRNIQDEQFAFHVKQKDAWYDVLRDCAKDATPDLKGIQVFDPLTAYYITNLYRNEIVLNGQNPRPVSTNEWSLQVSDPFMKLHYYYSKRFMDGFVDNLTVGEGSNRSVRIVFDPLASDALIAPITNQFGLYTNVVLGSYTGQVATISTNPIPERQEGLDPEDARDYTQSLADSFEDVDSILDPLRRIGDRIENISIDPDFGDNSGSPRFYIIRPENAFWNSFSFMRSRSGDADGGLYIDFSEGQLRNFVTKCNDFLTELIHWLQPILVFLVIYHEARWTLNFFHHDRDL